METFLIFYLVNFSFYLVTQCNTNLNLNKNDLKLYRQIKT